jgi:hypothetical protein
MGRLREAALNQLRSPEKALCDLIEKHDRMPSDHPGLAELSRMIRQLAAEVTKGRQVDLTVALRSTLELGEHPDDAPAM